MKFKINNIQFDFETDEGLADSDVQSRVIEHTLNKEWVTDDEEYLADIISDETGWCILHFDYTIIE